MWGGPPFSVADNCSVDVRNLAAARNWYQEKLGLNEVHEREEDDSGRRFADMGISKRASICISLVEMEPGASPQKQHVILYAKNLERVRQFLAERGVTTEPVSTDSGGNHLFRFLDSDGNAIEVCVEPE